MERAGPAPVCDAVAYRGDEVIPLQHIVVHRNAQPVSHGLQKTFYNGNDHAIWPPHGGRRRYLKCCMQLQNPAQPNRLPQRPRRLMRPSQQAPAVRDIRKGRNLRRAEISHKMCREPHWNTCHLCVFIGIRPEIPRSKYRPRRRRKGAPVPRHHPYCRAISAAWPACCVSSQHNHPHRPPRRSAAAQDKSWRPLFPGYRFTIKACFIRVFPFPHFIIIIPHLCKQPQLPFRAKKRRVIKQSAMGYTEGKRRLPQARRAET